MKPAELDRGNGATESRWSGRHIIPCNRPRSSHRSLSNDQFRSHVGGLELAHVRDGAPGEGAHPVGRAGPGLFAGLYCLGGGPTGFISCLSAIPATVAPGATFFRTIAPAPTMPFSPITTSGVRIAPV